MTFKAKRKGETTILLLKLLPPGVEVALGYPEIAQALGLSDRTVRTMVARGEYPPPETMIGNKSKWKLETHNAWVRAKFEEQIRGRRVPSKS